MQHTNKPKPSGLRPPQIRAFRPLGPLPENAQVLTQRARVHKPLQVVPHEAPAISHASQQRPPIMPSKLRRRSKSVSDLTEVTNKPVRLATLKMPLRVPITAKKMPVKGTLTKPAAATGSKVTVGSKRGAENKNCEEGPSKPKMKKIPSWNYKERFLELKEKYNESLARFADLEEQLSNMETMKNEHIETLNRAKLYENQIKLLETKVVRFNDLENELQQIRTCKENLETDLQAAQKENIDLVEHKEKLDKAYKEASAKCLATTNELAEARELIHSYESQVSRLKNELIQHELDRRIKHNIIQDLKGNIRVFCRVRPPLPTENDKLEVSYEYVDDTTFSIRKSRESVNQITGKVQDFRSEFSFDKVFPPGVSQEEVFEDLAQLVQSALDGYHVCVFAYGQTGSGKTYTMQGGERPHEQGMIPRTVNLIFKSIDNLKISGWQYTVEVSFLEIYNENVRDLLDPKGGKKLNICFNEGKGTTVNNITMKTIKSAKELETYMEKAQQVRATAATNFNEHSSRSHAITKISLRGTNQLQNLTYSGSVNLVDLAGSESAKQTVDGERLTETKNINKSLSTLGDVILALHAKAKHIPYRNSKLTYLLQSCLGGNSKTLMIVNISPFEDCFGETISSLRFASKVKEVKTASKRNKAAIT